jgi:hypothetical protein
VVDTLSSYLFSVMFISNAITCNSSSVSASIEGDRTVENKLFYNEEFHNLYSLSNQDGCDR